MPRSSDTDSVRRLMLFFAVVYTVEGIGQAKVGIVWQPLTYFLKTQYGWTALQIAASLAVLDVPWVIKPLYGLVSDFLPLFGYRRRSYLLLSNLAAVAAFAWVTQVTAPGPIVFALLLTSIAMAVSSTLCGALLVENGQRHNDSAAFVNQQWLWFNGAVAATSLAGGGLIEIFSPAGALHVAALIAAIAPLAVLVCLHLVEEARAGIDRAELRRRLDGLLNTFRSRTLWLIAAFLFCYYYSPGFGTPLYFYMTDHLHFSQGFIGALSAVSAVGWVAGGLLYRWLLTGMRTRALLQLSIVLGTLGTLAYLLMRRSDQRGGGVFPVRHCRHDRQCRDADPGGGPQPGARRGVRLRGPDVGDQPGDAVGGHQRRVPLRACIRRPPRAADRGVGRLHRLRAGADPAVRDRARSE